MVFLAAMLAAGTGLKAQEVTIVLTPGWNWISCPMMDTLDFETALGSFTPAAGDMIKSRWGQAIYTNGHWMGSISQFFPGYGFHYKSNRTMPVLVTFNAQQPAPQVVVTTSELTDITTNSATCGGNVTSSSGDYVFVFSRGICWGTSPNPAFNDNYIEAGNGLGNFNVSMTELTPGTTYYVRAFAVTPMGTSYGEELSFITLDSGGVIGGHEYVDLGLPSGLLWATCNVGANAPEDYGNYYAWGETAPKSNYSWSTYQYSMGYYNTLTKYCAQSNYGYNGFTDNLTTLLPEDDAATANWGSNWRMPTQAEFQELLDNTTVTWTTRNGVNGRLFTASNGNSLFLPAAGCRDYGGLSGAGSLGCYWSSSLSTVYPEDAWGLFFTSGYCSVEIFSCFSEQSVRPVCSSQNHAYVDLGLPSGLLWATCNVGAYTPEDYGDYFAWGETEPKSGHDLGFDYTWNTYQYSHGSFNYYGEWYAYLTKYCYDSNWGYNDYTDNLITLLSEDDAATVNWGADWRMPTLKEWKELLYNTTNTWTTQNGVNGMLFTASNGNSLFLPAASYQDDSGGDGDKDAYNGNLHYWSRSLDMDEGPMSALIFFAFYEGDYYDYDYVPDQRYVGMPVRPVRSASQSNAPTGAIDGLFSVSDTKTVYFSQGNLQYNASTDFWRFAENQYNYLSNYYPYYDWIDLFGWGTGNNPSNSSTNNGNYNIFSDWGNNPIINGGNTPNQWRTLTQTEWDYVFNTRATTSGIRYAKAKVNDVNGVILLPDDWSSSIYSFNNTNNSSANYSSNVISAAQWFGLEHEGAVFLPAAGGRSGTNPYNVGTLGYYWSSTYDSNNNNNAYFVLFNNVSLTTDYSDYRCRGRSVRLVRDSE